MVGVSGGIAAYKTCELVRLYVDSGAEVHVVMTHGATQFVTPLTFETLSGNPVMTDVFALNGSKIWHIDLPTKADVAVIVPATANIVARMAQGLADDPVTTFLLATQAKVLVAPAMNTNMYAHPAYRKNEATLRQFGYEIIEPGEGFLACGFVGKGRMAEPDAIFRATERSLAPRTLGGKRVLVTAGPTREYWDSARFISNPSSGKMGFALAQEAWLRGAEVTLVSGPVGLPDPVGVRVVRVESGEEMHDRAVEAFATADVTFMAAAVGDFVPDRRVEGKIKKRETAGNGVVSLSLKGARDILAQLGKVKNGKFLVGFAAEPGSKIDSAISKLREKNLDLLIANPIDGVDNAFESDQNKVTVFTADGRKEAWPKMAKEMVARKIVDYVGARLPGATPASRNIVRPVHGRT